MKLPVQPPQYDRNLEQQRSLRLEQEIQQIMAELQRLKDTQTDHETRLQALEP